MCINFGKKLFGLFLGGFLTNSSGHPVSDPFTIPGR
jgi:hypothetical protein